METILLIVIGLIICSIVTAILPKEFVYSIILGIVCGWLSTKLLVYVDTKTAFSTMYFFPSIVGFIHGLGWSVKITCFVFLSIFFWITGLSKFLGKGLLFIIGISVLIIIFALFCLFMVQLFTGLSGSL
ncbi:MAG: hypothetical protein E7005_06545 [Alphaproteobacteria bacterium]|nr:hypothetical protein [Alphaproteobacteria bacterium]